MLTSRATTTATPWISVRAKKNERRNHQRKQRAKARKYKGKIRHLFALFYKCPTCWSDRVPCPCGSTCYEVFIARCVAKTLPQKSLAKSRQTKPNPYGLGTLFRQVDARLVDRRDRFTDPWFARLRAAGFLRRKGKWSAKDKRKWLKRLARRDAYFATEKGKQQTEEALARKIETMLRGEE